MRLARRHAYSPYGLGGPFHPPAEPPLGRRCDGSVMLRYVYTLWAHRGMLDSPAVLTPRYLATGRGFVMRHEKFDEIYRFYAVSHFYKVRSIGSRGFAHGCSEHTAAVLFVGAARAVCTRLSRGLHAALTRFARGSHAVGCFRYDGFVRSMQVLRLCVQGMELIAVLIVYGMALPRDLAQFKVESQNKANIVSPPPPPPPPFHALPCSRGERARLRNATTASFLDCTPHVACCMLHTACRMLHAACCMPSVAWCTLPDGVQEFNYWLLTWSVWVVAITWVFAPFWFNPLGFHW